MNLYSMLIEYLMIKNYKMTQSIRHHSNYV